MMAVDPPKHLSPSGFSMYRQCPAKWWKFQ